MMKSKKISIFALWLGITLIFQSGLLALGIFVIFDRVPESLYTPLTFFSFIFVFLKTFPMSYPLLYSWYLGTGGFLPFAVAFEPYLVLFYLIQFKMTGLIVKNLDTTFLKAVRKLGVPNIIL